MKTPTEDTLPSHQSLRWAILGGGGSLLAITASRAGGPAGQQPGATSLLQGAQIPPLAHRQPCTTSPSWYPPGFADIESRRPGCPVSVRTSLLFSVPHVVI